MEEVGVAWLKSRESLQRVVEVVSRVRDEILEQSWLFCLCLAITADQLDPLVYAFEKDTISGPGAEESGVDV